MNNINEIKQLEPIRDVIISTEEYRNLISSSAKLDIMKSMLKRKSRYADIDDLRGILDIEVSEEDQ